MTTTENTPDNAGYHSSRRNALGDIFENMEATAVSRLRQVTSDSGEVFNASEQPSYSSCQTPCDDTRNVTLDSCLFQTSTSRHAGSEDTSCPDSSTDGTGQMHVAHRCTYLHSLNTDGVASSRMIKMEFSTSSEQTTRMEDSTQQSNATFQTNMMLTRRSLSFIGRYHSTDAAFPMATRAATGKMTLARSRSDYTEYTRNLWFVADVWNKTSLLL